MDSQGLCPYGIKSLIECVSRATLIAQPGDIPNFLAEYLSELVSFRDSNHETNVKDVSFHYEELWGKFALL
uniref:RIIa domain-containing protein n=1 Tax=Lates calcarifer TaxID=8187 RepID=A0A4W6FIZ5_LATCA